MALTENISRMSDLFNQFMCQHATSGQGENLARASGHSATPPVEVTPTTNGMDGTCTSARGVPLVGDDGTGPIAEYSHSEGTLITMKTMAILKNTKPSVFKGED